MRLEEIREIVFHQDSDGGLVSKWEFERKFKRNLELVLQSAKKEHKNKIATKWLTENANLYQTYSRQISFRNFQMKIWVAGAIKELISNPDFHGSKEEFTHFFEAITQKGALSEKELEGIPIGFFYYLTEQIAHASVGTREEIPRLISFFHKLKSVDFGIFCSAFSPIEKILRFDSTGVYQKMTKSTVSLYRDLLKSEAKKRRVPLESLCEEKIKKAREKKVHFGLLLEQKKKNNFYFSCVFLVFFFLIFDFLFSLKNPLLTLFLAPSLYFFVKKLIDFITSFLIRSKPLPAIKIDEVSEENKTCVIITSLLQSKEDIDVLCEKLRQYRINNKQKDDRIYFGLLCDLKESREKNLPEDGALIRTLEEKIDTLNEEDHVHFAIVRGRVFHKSEGTFAGWERKRGAIEQFVSYLQGLGFDHAALLGECKSIIGTKYLLTLDFDTRLGIGQVKRLVGIAAHPLNQPKVDTRNGRMAVVSGHAIFQPKISTSLLEKIKTPFGKIYGNGSGNILYASASFDQMQHFFGEGNFCGKGLICVPAYHQVMVGALPEQKILSHDMPEGALLRCALVTNEYFSDSNPQTTISHYKRLHRWIRGDIQNLFLLPLLSGHRRILLFENALRYLVPLSEFILLIFSFLIGPWYGLICALLVIFFHFEEVFFTLTSIFLSGNVELIRRRFATRMRNLILNAFYKGVLSLSAIAFEAYYFTDAVMRSLYRMFISGRKLLQWQVYLPFSQGKNLNFFLPSFILSLISLFVFRLSPAILFSVLWISYPLVCTLISEEYKEKAGFSKGDKEKLLEYAKKEFRFFQECVDKNTNHLPPDNIQLEPYEKIAMRTSPTNIGLYLASLVSARDMGIIGTYEMAKKMDLTLNTLDRLERWNGHLYNWYDLSSLEVIGERFISTVDSGNYVACLIGVLQALKEYKGEEVNLNDLIQRLEREVENVNFVHLLDPEKSLFRVGLFPDDREKSGSLYDLYMSEARTTAYLAIGLGQIGAHLWSSLSRPLFSYRGRVGIGSWTGTAFEYFMPPLFLPVIENSLEDETLDFAYFCQRSNGSFVTPKEQVFGISESGYSLTDASGNYQYKAFGIMYLAMNPAATESKVISPYSSFLMLERRKKDVILNLEKLEKFGLCGAFGFFEACEFHSCFLGDYSKICSYMSHHKGMSMVALNNAINDNLFQKRLMSYGQLSSKVELLAERFPIEGKVFKRKREKAKLVLREETGLIKEISLDENSDEAHLICDGKMSILSYGDGYHRFLYRGIDLFDGNKRPFSIRVILGKDEYIFFGTDKRIKVQFYPGQIQYRLVLEKVLVTVTLELVGGKNAFLLHTEILGFTGPCRLEVGFGVVLQNLKEWNAHPAFHALSLECEKKQGKMRIIRRLNGGKECLSLSSSAPFRVHFQDKEFDRDFSLRPLIRPEMKISFDFPKGYSDSVTCLFSLSGREGEGLGVEQFAATGEIEKNVHSVSAKRIANINQICALDKDCREIEKKALMSLRKGSKTFLMDTFHPWQKDVLWRYGISGDYPIVSLTLDGSEECIKTAGRAMRVAKKLFLAGVDMDFVILYEDRGEYFDPIREEVTDLVMEYQCEFLIGKHPGIHIVSESGENHIFQFASHLCLNEDPPKSQKMPEQMRKIEVLSYSGDGMADQVGEFEKGAYRLDKRKFNPVTPFSHVVSNRACGFVCDQNSLGFTWFRNAGLNRISKWENIPDLDTGEKVYLEYNGKIYDLLASSYLSEYRRHFAIYNGEIDGEKYRIIATCSEYLSGKMVYVELSDQLQETGTLIYSFVPALGIGSEQNSVAVKEDHIFLLYPALFGEYPCGAFVFAKDREVSISRNGERLEFSFPAEGENVIFLGGFSSQNHLSFLKQKLTEVTVEEVLEREKLYSDHLFSGTKPYDRDEFWIRYQSTHARFFGRTGLYQSSGAYGFRDQLQDCLIFLEVAPEITKRHILRSASHQFLEGDVLHWWHTTRQMKGVDVGVRTRCSDDYLWLLFAVSEYIRKTGDDKILEISVPFLSSEELKEGERERYLLPRKAEGATLREHLKRCADLVLRRGLGSNDLPPIGSGDWNDGMNMLSGESVWLGFFAGICLNRCLLFFDEETQNSIKEYLSRLHAGLEAAFNGSWFVRAYLDSGVVLGNDVTMEGECSMDLITQAFSAFYALEMKGTLFSLDGEKVKKSLANAFINLSDEKTRTTRLFATPFVNTKPTPGYIQRYCAGVRENGGQYTHAAVWFAQALLDFGEAENEETLIEMGRAVFDRLDPFQNNLMKNFIRYRREPYVLCGDVYTAKGVNGHGGWSWYTGAAGWYLRLLERKKKLEKEK